MSKRRADGFGGAPDPKRLASCVTSSSTTTGTSEPTRNTSVSPIGHRMSELHLQDGEHTTYPHASHASHCRLAKMSPEEQQAELNLVPKYCDHRYGKGIPKDQFELIRKRLGAYQHGSYSIDFCAGYHGCAGKHEGSESCLSKIRAILVMKPSVREGLVTKAGPSTPASIGKAGGVIADAVVEAGFGKTIEVFKCADRRFTEMSVAEEGYSATEVEVDFVLIDVSKEDGPLKRGPVRSQRLVHCELFEYLRRFETAKSLQSGNQISFSKKPPINFTSDVIGSVIHYDHGDAFSIIWKEMLALRRQPGEHKQILFVEHIDDKKSYDVYKHLKKDVHKDVYKADYKYDYKDDYKDYRYGYSPSHKLLLLYFDTIKVTRSSTRLGNIDTEIWIANCSTKHRSNLIDSKVLKRTYLSNQELITMLSREEFFKFWEILKGDGTVLATEP